MEINDKLILNKIKQIHQNSLHKEFWNISYTLGEELEKIVLQKNPKNVLEFGTSNGFSTLWIKKALSQAASITTIEINSKRADIARQNFLDCNLKNIQIINQNIFTYLEQIKYQTKYDFIFLDASQKNYLKIFQLLEKYELLDKNFLLVADNILSHTSTQNFTEYVKTHYKTSIIEKDSGFILVSNFN